MTALGISGSSVGVWNDQIYGPGYDDSALLFGQPRPVRGDEWLLTTAMTAAQAKVDFAHINQNVALGQEMSVLGGAPTAHWTTLFKPHNWAFFALPLENAIAFKWLSTNIRSLFIDQRTPAPRREGSPALSHRRISQPLLHTVRAVVVLDCRRWRPLPT